MAAEGQREQVGYSCTCCDWVGFLVECEEDCSVAAQGELCPCCWSHVEPVEQAEA